MGKVLDLFSKEKPAVEDKEILLDKEVIEEANDKTPFERIMEANRLKKEKHDKERAKDNTGVLKTYRIKE